MYFSESAAESKEYPKGKGKVADSRSSSSTSCSFRITISAVFPYLFHFKDGREVFPNKLMLEKRECLEIYRHVVQREPFRYAF